MNSIPSPSPGILQRHSPLHYSNIPLHLLHHPLREHSVLGARYFTTSKKSTHPASQDEGPVFNLQAALSHTADSKTAASETPGLNIRRVFLEGQKKPQKSSHPKQVDEETKIEQVPVEETPTPPSSAEAKEESTNTAEIERGESTSTQNHQEEDHNRPSLDEKIEKTDVNTNNKSGDTLKELIRRRAISSSIKAPALVESRGGSKAEEKDTLTIIRTPSGSPFPVEDGNLENPEKEKISTQIANEMPFSHYHSTGEAPMADEGSKGEGKNTAETTRTPSKKPQARNNSTPNSQSAQLPHRTSTGEAHMIDGGSKVATGNTTAVVPKSKENKRKRDKSTPNSQKAQLPHLTSNGEAHMVDVGSKAATKRRAVATAKVCFTNPQTAEMIETEAFKKGDVLAVARVAGIMAAKRTSDIIPLCHPIALTHVSVDLMLIKARRNGSVLESAGGVHIRAAVECIGQTGVEMEALTAVSAAGLTIIDMIKKVDMGSAINDLKINEKDGGRSGHLIRDKYGISGPADRKKQDKI